MTKLSSNENRRLPSGRRMIFTMFFIPLAAVALCYGFVFHSTTVSLQKNDETLKSPNLQQVISLSFLVLREPEIIQDTTVGGLIRLDSGAIKRTYSGQPPSLCPT